MISIDFRLSKNNLYNIKKDIFKMINGEKIFSAMVVFGFLYYHGNMLSIPNKELKIKFIEALSYEADDCEDEFSILRHSNGIHNCS